MERVYAHSCTHGRLVKRMPIYFLQVNMMPREKLLGLCDTYFESAPANIRALLRDPRDWPSKEYHLNHLRPQSPGESAAATDPSATEDKEEEGEPTTQLNRNNSAAVLLTEGTLPQICDKFSPPSELSYKSEEKQEAPKKNIPNRLSLGLSHFGGTHCEGSLPKHLLQEEEVSGQAKDKINFQLDPNSQHRSGSEGLENFCRRIFEASAYPKVR
ncbi:unnamed protein product [Dicrocoelium dendriticum]|nr:unnamed protein product [Dicrocoelium dendriticum]